MYAAPGSWRLNSEETARRTQAAAVPRKAAINNGLITTTLMDCMAAMPCAAGRRARAFITKDEKAKKTPAINPQPSAEKSVKAKSNLSIILSLQASHGFSALVY